MHVLLHCVDRWLNKGNSFFATNVRSEVFEAISYQYWVEDTEHYLTQLFPITLSLALENIRKLHGVEIGCIGDKWLKKPSWTASVAENKKYGVL